VQAMLQKSNLTSIDKLLILYWFYYQHFRLMSHIDWCNHQSYLYISLYLFVRSLTPLCFMFVDCWLGIFY
jgi:hypothetical protein